MVQTEEGKWTLPEDIDESVAFAANSERRRRDTQSAFTKSQQELKQTQAERDQFAKGWEADFAKSLSTEHVAELEELKATDPDAWRSRLNELEGEQRNAFQSKSKAIQEKAAGESELDYRHRALSEWQEANPTLVLTDDVLANDIPPRIARKLEEGKVSFADFLKECGDYLGKGKVVAPPTDKVPGNVDLGKLPGGSAPGGDAVAAASKNSYNDEVYQEQYHG